MIWKQHSKHCLSTAGGYLISRYKLETGDAFVARSPGHRILFSGSDLEKAKAACVAHLAEPGTEAKDRTIEGLSG